MEMHLRKMNWNKQILFQLKSYCVNYFQCRWVQYYNLFCLSKLQIEQLREHCKLFENKIKA